MAYLHNNKDQFQDAIELAYEQTGIMAQAIEKDYYVTMLLRLLSEKMPYIVFKGGTSLSKCHKVIKRFSEDIDITIDTQISQGKKKKIKQAIVSSADELGMNIENLDETRSRRNYNRYIISYDSVLPLSSDALSPAVLLETSYTAISFPTVILPVHSYIGDMMDKEAPDSIEEFMLLPFPMKVDETFKNLVHEVRNIRAQSPICLSALPDVNVPQLLEQIIEEKAYKNDYDNLTTQLLEEKLSYDIVINSLKDISKSGIFK